MAAGRQRREERDTPGVRPGSATSRLCPCLIFLIYKVVLTVLGLHRQDACGVAGRVEGRVNQSQQRLWDAFTGGGTCDDSHQWTSGLLPAG